MEKLKENKKMGENKIHIAVFFGFDFNNLFSGMQRINTQSI